MSSLPSTISLSGSSPIFNQKKTSQLKYYGVPWTFVERDPVFQTRPVLGIKTRARNNSLTVKCKPRGVPLFMNSSTEFSENERDLINRAKEDNPINQRSISLGGDSRVEIAKAIHIQSMTHMNDFFEQEQPEQAPSVHEEPEEQELISGRSLSGDSIFEHSNSMPSDFSTDRYAIQKSHSDIEEFDKPQLKRAIMESMTSVKRSHTQANPVQLFNYQMSNNGFANELPNRGRDRLREVVSRFSDSNITKVPQPSSTSLANPTFCASQLSKFCNEKRIPLPPIGRTRQ